MSKPKPTTLGHLVGATGPLQLDVARLVETRLVIQASSGGGKSMALRTLMERTHGQLPQIILDKDGEFSTLRERFNYILAGKDGDLPADPRTAALLATKVLELDASIIIDLYDLSPADKHRFVRLFLQAVLNAPKSLWRPRLLAIDEAHRFCPENGEGTSEAKDSVIECCDNGRKRGLGIILATQRIAKLDKSALAECGNKLIGLTNMDDDRRRAGRELGLSVQADLLQLRDLSPGEFFAVGPALSHRQVVRAAVDKASTTHPRAGHRVRLRAPAPTAVVKAQLAKLADLPKEAEKDLQDKASMQLRIRELEARIRAQEGQKQALPAGVTQGPRAAQEPSKAVLEGLAKKAASQAQHMAEREVAKALAGLEKAVHRAVTEALKGLRQSWKPEVGSVQDLKLSQQDIQRILTMTDNPKKWLLSRSLPEADSLEVRMGQGGVLVARDAPEGKVSRHPGLPSLTTGDRVPPLGICERRILAFLRIRGQAWSTRAQVGAMAGYVASSGNFGNNLSALAGKGLIERRGQELRLQPNLYPDIVDQLVGGERASSLQDWIQKLGKCEKAIYEKLLSHPGLSFNRGQLAEATGYEASSGNFGNNLSSLCTKQLAKREGDFYRLHPELKDFL